MYILSSALAIRNDISGIVYIKDYTQVDKHTTRVDKYVLSIKQRRTKFTKQYGYFKTISILDFPTISVRSKKQLSIAKAIIRIPYVENKTIFKTKIT